MVMETILLVLDTPPLPGSYVPGLSSGSVGVVGSKVAGPCSTAVTALRARTGAPGVYCNVAVHWVLPPPTMYRALPRSRWTRLSATRAWSLRWPASANCMLARDRLVCTTRMAKTSSSPINMVTSNSISVKPVCRCWHATSLKWQPGPG